jgi:flagellar basal-body rod protein FlgB
MIEKLFNSDNYAMTKSMMDVAASRQDALAANIANVETPGYRRVDISKTFLQELESQFRSGERLGSTSNPVIEADATARSIRADGNNVELDNELLQMGSNEMQYEMLADFVSGSLARLKTAITGRVAP